MWLNENLHKRPVRETLKTRQASLVGKGTAEGASRPLHSTWEDVTDLGEVLSINATVMNLLSEFMLQ